MAEPDLSAGSLIPELPHCLIIDVKIFSLDKEEMSSGGGEADHSFFFFFGGTVKVPSLNHWTAREFP